MQFARQWSRLVSAPLNILATISRPVVWLLGKATDIVVRLCGGDPSVGREQLSPDELLELVIAHPGLTADQRTIITGALEIHERPLRDVLVLRLAVITLPDDMSIEQTRTTLAESGHSRAPVVHSGDLDDVVGVVHLRDLLADHRTVGAVARPALQLPTASESPTRCSDSRLNASLLPSSSTSAAALRAS